MNKRILTAFVAAVSITTVAVAIPAKRISKTITQPDGATVTLTQMGDERYHSYVTSDGLTVDFTPEGYAVYRTTDGTTGVYVHELSQRTAEETSLIAAKSTRMTFQAARAAAPRFQAMQEQDRQQSAVKLRRVNNKISVEQNSSQVPHKGVAKVPIILAQYKDIKFSGEDPKADFQDFFMGDGISAHSYFYDMSQGQYDPQFEIIGPVTLSKDRSYYGGNSWYQTDTNLGEMVKEAVQLANPDTDFSEFDNNGDKKCDVVIILYAGVGEASSGVDDSVWPCRWTLSSSGAGSVSCDGVTVNDFAVFNELNGTKQHQIDGIGTFCHEFSHCLGLPDFYETTYANGYYGMDVWSIMDYGCYNNDTYTPMGYSAYEKAFMGWSELTEGEADTKYSLPILNVASDPQSLAVCLVNKKDDDEYFIFENRAKQGWDAYMPDEGMMINHVTYSASAWSGNTVNNTSTQRMTIVPADNELSRDTNDSDLWPKSYATEFTDTSTPSAKVYKGGHLGIPVTEIERNDEGIVSFWVDKIPLPVLSVPTLTGDQQEATGSFSVSWEPVACDATDVTYTLQAWPLSTDLLVPEIWFDFTKSGKANTEWTIDGYVKVYSSYALFGSSTIVGSLTSVNTLSPENGAITIVVNACKHGSDTGRMRMSVVDEDGNVAGSDLVTAGASREYVSALITGLDDSKQYKLRIANEGESSRFRAYNLMAFSGDVADDVAEAYDNALAAASEENTGDDQTSADSDAASEENTGNNQTSADNDATGVARRAMAEEAAEPEVTAVGNHITVTGIIDSTYTLTDLPASKYGYRIKAVPVDETKAAESSWSDVNTITLAEMSGIDAVRVDNGLLDGDLDGALLGNALLNGNTLTAADVARLIANGAELYDIAGRRLARPQSGLNILRLPNGTVAKLRL
jgi:M6 family metalloprotease-like protein